MLTYIIKRYCAPGCKANQFLLAFLVVLPIFSYGNAVGWLSPMGPLLMSENSPAKTPVHSVVVSWMASIVYLVSTPTVFLFGYIVDNYGRKKALMLTSLSMVVCWGLKLYSTETWALITARAMVGIGTCGSYVVTPLYIKEISEDSIRGLLGSLVVLSQNLGNLVVYILGEYLSYNATLWVCLAVPIFHLIMFSMMPDTPSYLLKSGKIKEARDALAWLRCRRCDDPILDEELNDFTNEVKEQTTGKFVTVLKKIVHNPSTFRALSIALLLTLAREMCGCLVIVHFASVIFSSAGHSFPLTPNQQAVILGSVQLVGSITASSLVDRMGRKKLLLGTCGVAGLTLFTISTWFTLRTVLGPESTDSTAWLPVAALCLCIYCDAAGLQPVPFVVMTEMFSFQNRGTVTSLIMMFACFSASIELRAFQPMIRYIGLHYVFWFFSAVCLVSTVYITLRVPETKMKSIEQIYEELASTKKREPSKNEFSTKL